MGVDPNEELIAEVDEELMREPISSDVAVSSHTQQCREGEILRERLATTFWRDYNTNNDSPNTIFVNLMITGFAQNGLGKEALDLFSKMQNERCEPNEITFLGVLSACVHVGLVEEGWKYFNMMKSVYHLVAEPNHYACMVDLLGRAGLVDEAMELISLMPFEPNAGVWGALLSASRTHLRLDLAHLAAQRLIELEPDNATPYVVLSSVYSISGKSMDGDQVRMTKKLKGIKKSPGCSWIVVKDKVHLFLAGDQSHMDIEEIKVVLQMIVMEMRQLHFHI